MTLFLNRHMKYGGNDMSYMTDYHSKKQKELRDAIALIERHFLGMNKEQITINALSFLEEQSPRVELLPILKSVLELYAKDMSAERRLDAVVELLFNYAINLHEDTKM